MKVCSKCNLEYDDEFKFCHHCGCELQIKEEHKFCPYCGKEVDVDSDFCPYCGKSIVDLKEQLDVSKSKVINNSDDCNCIEKNNVDSTNMSQKSIKKENKVERKIERKVINRVESRKENRDESKVVSWVKFIAYIVGACVLFFIFEILIKLGVNVLRHEGFGFPFLIIIALAGCVLYFLLYRNDE